MKVPTLVKALNYVDDDLINASILYSGKRRKRVQRTAIAACLCLLLIAAAFLIPLIPDSAKQVPLHHPMLITVYAMDEDGSKVQTALDIGKKIKLYPETSPYAEDFHGFAFDLTLLSDAEYVLPVAVNDDWSPKLYPGSGDQYDENDFHWSLTEGNDLWTVHMKEDGSAVRPGESELSDPKPHGSRLIWRPNQDGLNKTVIHVFDAQFQPAAQYYLEITQAQGDYYAEIVKIVQ